MLKGGGSGTGGSRAPGRVAALSGWISAGGSFASGFFAATGTSGDVNVGTGANVVSGCGTSEVSTGGAFSGFLRRGLPLESKPVLPAPKPVGLP